MNNLIKPLLISFSTLTLLPVSPKHWKPADVKASVAFYPLVGALLGGILALVSRIHFAHELKILLILLTWVIGTAAFHLDGLADCCDGFFGGKTPEGRRRIMKDSATGAYGVTGIALILLFKYSLLGQLWAGDGVWKWLLLIPLAARWAVTLSCTVFNAPPGDKGLGSQVLGLPAPFFSASTLLSLAAGVVLLKIQALEVFFTAGVVALAVGFLSQSKIRGLTGDGLGATIELAEAVCLFFAVLMLHNGFPQL